MVATGPRPLIQFGFEDCANRRAIRIGLQILNVRNQQDHFEQKIKVLTSLGGHRDHDDIAAPVFRQQSTVGELLLYPVGLCIRLVDLVDRNNDGDAGRSCVINGLQRLRHHAIIGGNHQDNDVGDFGATGAHACECLVTGGIDKDDFAVVFLDLVCADVLRDAASFATSHVGLANGVKQRCFAVIDVTHDRNHWCAADQFVRSLQPAQFLESILLRN